MDVLLKSTWGEAEGRRGEDIKESEVKRAAQHISSCLKRDGFCLLHDEANSSWTGSPTLKQKTFIIIILQSLLSSASANFCSIFVSSLDHFSSFAHLALALLLKLASVLVLLHFSF